MSGEDIEGRYAMRVVVWTGVILAAGAAISGCGQSKLYEGEQLPTDKVATLVWTPPLDLSSSPANVAHIDGAPVSIWVDRAEILPGKHTVSGEVRSGSAVAPVAFSTEFTAEAGHTYQVVGTCTQRDKCTASVTDSGTTPAE